MTGATDVSDVLQERLIDAEYKIWKKNTPYLYDIVMTHALEWPSLTCQWLPTVKKTSLPHVQEHSLLLGTHTTGEQNYLMVASCNLPKDDKVQDEPNSNTNATSTTTTNNNSNTNAAPAASAKVNYDEDKGEVGGFGTAHSSVGKIEIRMKIQHDGEVNRARYMPQNHFIVATRGPSADVYIYDLAKHPSFPTSQKSEPQLILQGHSKEGYALRWSPLQKGYLLSGSEDQTVCLWNIEMAAGNGNKLQAQTILRGHTDVVEDVDWHPKDPNLVCSVSDDASLRLWDLRDPMTASNKANVVVAKAHESDINCVAFNPQQEFILCTGSADQTVGIWDIRNLKQRTHTLTGHNDQVYMVQWSPFNESILGSASADRRVGIWDLSRIGQEQTPEDAQDGPPELLFLHGGHTSKVSDFSWNPAEPWTIASVSEDNVLQVWQMAEEIYAADDDDDDDGNEEEDDDVDDDDDDDDDDDGKEDNLNKKATVAEADKDKKGAGDKKTGTTSSSTHDQALGDDELE